MSSTSIENPTVGNPYFITSSDSSVQVTEAIAAFSEKIPDPRETLVRNLQEIMSTEQTFHDSMGILLTALKTPEVAGIIPEKKLQELIQNVSNARRGSRALLNLMQTDGFSNLSSENLPPADELIRNCATIMNEITNTGLPAIKALAEQYNVLLELTEDERIKLILNTCLSATAQELGGNPGLELDSYLIMPVQRTPRYGMLFEETRKSLCKLCAKERPQHLLMQLQLLVDKNEDLGEDLTAPAALPSASEKDAGAYIKEMIKSRYNLGSGFEKAMLDMLALSHEISPKAVEQPGLIQTLTTLFASEQKASPPQARPRALTLTRSVAEPSLIKPPSPPPAAAEEDTVLAKLGALGGSLSKRASSTRASLAGVFNQPPPPPPALPTRPAAPAAQASTPEPIVPMAHGRLQRQSASTKLVGKEEDPTKKPSA